MQFAALTDGREMVCAGLLQQNAHGVTLLKSRNFAAKENCAPRAENAPHSHKSQQFLRMRGFACVAAAFAVTASAQDPAQVRSAGFIVRLNF